MPAFQGTAAGRSKSHRVAKSNPGACSRSCSGGRPSGGSASSAHAAHAVGTSKALQMGEVEGAMSGLSIAVAGVLTAVLCPVFVGFIQ